MSKNFIKSLLSNEEFFDYGDALQSANIELLSLLGEARKGLLSEYELDLRMLEIKTKISILERQEKLAKSSATISKSTEGAYYSPTQYKHPEEAKAPKNITINQDSYVYGDDWVVMQNRLLHAISRLSVDERRLILFLSPLVRREVNENPKQRAFFVPALSYGKAFNINPKNVYRKLAKTAKDIQHKPFFYWQWRENHYNERGVAWFSECEYMKEKGGIEVVIGEAVLEMLTIFDKHNQFTKYQKEFISRLGAYGIVLFELIASCMHQEHKKKTYPIKYLREKFDCVETYERINDFKKNVIDNAILDIEKHTPYRIKYEQKKTGKEITDITFTFEDTSVQKNYENVIAPESSKAITQKTPTKAKRQSWQDKGLTIKQISKLSFYKDQFVEANTHLLRDKNISHYEAFESFKDQLQNPEHVGKFHLLAEFLDLKKGDEPPKAAKNSVQSKKKASKATAEVSKNRGLTAEQIEFFANHPQFQMDHPVKMYEVGSENHINYLKFRMDAAPGEFVTTDFDKYLN